MTRSGEAASLGPSGVRPTPVLHVVVVGAGVGGLGAALALSRAGHRVTLLERDDTAMPDSAEAAFDWDRRGAPQVRHSHGFAARLHQVLQSRFPDVLAELREAGAVEHDLRAMLPEDLRGDIDDLKVIAARRTTYEWVLRCSTLRSPLVDLRVGVEVRSLLPDATNTDQPPGIVGVQLDDGNRVRADAVVASTGPRSDLVRWLEPHGVVIPEVVTKTGITYLTRFYRLRPGHALPGGIVQTSSRRAGLSYSCVEADNGTFSITIAVESSDRELRRHLLQTGPFDAVCRLLPGIDTVTDPAAATPMTDVHAMGGLINRQRRFLDAQGRPRVVGFHALGDAHTTTNPLYGRGCSLAMVQAVLLSDSFVEHPSDPVARAVGYEEASAREIEPWYRFAVDGDALRSDPQIDPHDPRFTLQDLLRVGATQPSLLPRTLRTLTLLATPDVLAGDPLFVETLAALRKQHAAKVAARLAEGYQPPLERADLLLAGLA